MGSSTSHNRKYMQAERHDELSSGVPADATEQAAARQERAAGGEGIAKGSKIVPALGGKAHKGSTRLTHRVAQMPVSEKLKTRARFMRKRTCKELADTVGAGYCGIIASALVKLASEDMALREAALEQGEVDVARRLGESARMHLLYGREICGKDAEARKETATPADAFEAAAAAARERLARGG